MISMQTISTSVVPWIEIDIDSSDCHTADEVYEKLRSQFGKLISGGKALVTALRVRITGSSEAHAELNRDPDSVRNEVMSLAAEYGNGLLWVERVQVATLPLVDREALLKRDDPIGEVARIVAELRRDTSRVAEWESIVELQKKLPAELAEGPDPLRIDASALSVALEEAEGLLLARLAAMESL
jgi:exonuclease SbcD